MTTEIEDLALSLPREERARLAKRLLDSLDEEQDFEQEWSNEIEQRLAAYQRGDAQARDVSEVLADLRSQIEPT